MNKNERFIWAREVLDVRKNDRILEIGCGAGLLVQLLAEEMTSGTVMAIDKSKPMIEKARMRNADFVEEGKVSFLTSDLISAQLAKGHFDKVVAFNVNVFMQQPQKELLAVKRCLKQDGRLYLFYQPPYQFDKAFLEKAIAPFSDNGFEIMNTIKKQLLPFPAFCIVAKPA